MTTKKISPQQDAGWGLIYRLNDLWRKVERCAPAGKYDEWNFSLDRIWCNLLYRNDVIITKDAKQEIIVSIELSEEDIDEKNFLDKKIFEARMVMERGKKNQETNADKKNFTKAKMDYYNALMLKDVWLKKFMNKLGLYLKEVTKDPSKAIYGGE